MRNRLVVGVLSALTVLGWTLVRPAPVDAASRSQEVTYSFPSGGVQTTCTYAGFASRDVTTEDGQTITNFSGQVRLKQADIARCMPLMEEIDVFVRYRREVDSPWITASLTQSFGPHYGVENAGQIEGAVAVLEVSVSVLYSCDQGTDEWGDPIPGGICVAPGATMAPK